MLIPPGCSPAPIVTSEEGQALQKAVWTEIVTVLEAVSPGCRSLAGL